MTTAESGTVVVLGYTTVQVTTDWTRERVAEIVAIDAMVANWPKKGRDMVRYELRSCATLTNTLDGTGPRAASSRRLIERTLAETRAFVEEQTPAAAPVTLTERQRELVCRAIRAHMLSIDQTAPYGVGAMLHPVHERDADMQALADALFVLHPGDGVPTLPIIGHHHIALPGEPRD